MLRTYFVAGVILAGGAATVGAQSGATSGPPVASVARKATTLVGCVHTDVANPEWFTLSDTKTGTTYRLTGANVKAYVWRNVRIVGGLVPSANLAAQAGAIDQTKAAMAFQGANPTGAGNIQPLEFSVTRVRRLTGSCAAKAGR